VLTMTVSAILGTKLCSPRHPLPTRGSDGV
jgi:hypothetical protein